MNYFGTDLIQAGHYMWDLSEDGTYLKDGTTKNLKTIPFDPEEMPRRINGNGFPRGTVKFYNESGYSICAIEGSCSDTRGGCKSVFWIKESLTDEQLKELILSIPVFNKIIDQMPFEIKW